MQYQNTKREMLENCLLQRIWVASHPKRGWQGVHLDSSRCPTNIVRSIAGQVRVSLRASDTSSKAVYSFPLPVAFFGLLQLTYEKRIFYIMYFVNSEDIDVLQV